jgi:riboflavin kinase/FMN adenylyltransferase
MTFEPNPREFFARRGVDTQALPLTQLSGVRDKLQALSEAGVDQVLFQRFDAAFAALSAEDFIQRILVDAMQVRWLVVGDDFRFGAGRRGSVEMLASAGARYGFELQTMPTITQDGARISSTGIRTALEQGNLPLAERLLGRPYRISGRMRDARLVPGETPVTLFTVPLAGHFPVRGSIFRIALAGLAPALLPALARLDAPHSHGVRSLRILVTGDWTSCTGMRADLVFLQAFAEPRVGFNRFDRYSDPGLFRSFSTSPADAAGSGRYCG